MADRGKEAYDWIVAHASAFHAMLPSGTQATGSLQYAASAAGMSWLAIGATDGILSVQGGVPVWRTPANILTDLTGQAGATFDWNSQALTGIAALTMNGALGGVSGLDATTEAAIEAAIDTLANLTSVQGHTVTLTGDFVRSGAHSLTLTTTGVTNVTLPTTGTVITATGAIAAVAGATQPFNSKGNSFSTVQATINDLAGDGWVYVPTGTWSEALTIANNNVILFGAGWSSIIDGGTTGTALTISGGYCTGKDIQLKTTQGQANTYHGLTVAGGAGFNTFTNVYVSASDEDGMVFDDSMNRIIGCLTKNCDNYGIRMANGGDSTVIVGSTIHTTGDDGVFLDTGAEDCVVDGNRIIAWTNEAIDDDSGTSTVGDNDTT